MLPILSTLLSPIMGSLVGETFSAIKEILNRILPPEKMSEKEKADLEQEMRKLEKFYKNRVEERIAESEQMFEARVAAEMQKPVWYRDIVRPIITLGWFGFYAWIKYMVVTEVLKDGFNYPGDLDALFNTYDLAIGLTITGFWFGGKFLERTLGKKDILKSLFNIIPGKK